MSSNYDEMAALLHKKEDLHPDLVPYIEEIHGFQAIRHPYMVEIPYTEEMNAIINARYNYKKEAIAKAKESGDYVSFIWLHERPSRWEAFESIEHLLDDEEYWTTLSEIWIDTENLWQQGYRRINKFLNTKRKHKDRMMDEKEHEALAALPQKIKVYRGHQEKNQLGFSWTLDYWFAVRLARRYNAKHPQVSTGIVDKSDVHALFLGRNEFEIVVNPKKVTGLSEFKLQGSPLLEEIISQFKLSKESIHGPRHWKKVHENCLRLGIETEGCDIKVCNLFAILHDSKRVDEDEDPDHGKRACNYVVELYEQKKLDVSEEQLYKLKWACEFHNDGLTHNDPTIGVCWDADRLDLRRVGVLPDIDFLSTKAAKAIVENKEWI